MGVLTAEHANGKWNGTSVSRPLFGFCPRPKTESSGVLRMVLKTMLEVPTKLTKLVKTKDCPQELTHTRQLDNTDVAHLLS